MRQVLNKKIVLVIDVSVNLFTLIALSRGEGTFHRCDEMSSRDDAGCECKIVSTQHATWVSPTACISKHSNCMQSCSPARIVSTAR